MGMEPQKCETLGNKEKLYLTIGTNSWRKELWFIKTDEKPRYVLNCLQQIP